MAETISAISKQSKLADQIDPNMTHEQLFRQIQKIKGTNWPLTIDQLEALKRYQDIQCYRCVSSFYYFNAICESIDCQFDEDGTTKLNQLILDYTSKTNRECIYLISISVTDWHKYDVNKHFDIPWYSGSDEWIIIQPLYQNPDLYYRKVVSGPFAGYSVSVQVERDGRRASIILASPKYWRF